MNDITSVVLIRIECRKENLSRAVVSILGVISVIESHCNLVDETNRKGVEHCEYWCAKIRFRKGLIDMPWRAKRSLEGLDLALWSVQAPSVEIMDCSLEIEAELYSDGVVNVFCVGVVVHWWTTMLAIFRWQCSLGSRRSSNGLATIH